jgi:microcompartment protein CcmL/EutN
VPTPLPNHEALGLLEIDGVPRAVRAQDAALKRAAVEILACAPVSPGKVVLVLAGDVANVEESLAAAEEVAGSAIIDRLLLPGIHPAVLAAFAGEKRVRGVEALALLELTTVAAAIVAADAAVKAAEVILGRMHLATGFGGRAYFTLWGKQCDVEAAVLAAQDVAGDRLRDQEIIPSPHDDLEKTLLARPWPLDPSA